MPLDSDSDVADDWAGEAEAINSSSSSDSEHENEGQTSPSSNPPSNINADAPTKPQPSMPTRPAPKTPSAPAAKKNTGKGKKAAITKEPEQRLRSPILCILGHVDAGKTKLLDKLRKTNVQDREAGGITQQIGATFFPRENLLEQCAKIDPKLDLKVPGLLIIDTPGHASFTNLRQRGSSLCDIAILVVDITHGIQPQALESLALLRKQKCPFVVVLNKIDRIYGWVSSEWTPCLQTLKAQKLTTQEHFKDRARKCLLELMADQRMTFALYWDNNNFRKNVCAIPTSAHTGEGLPDLLALIVRITQDLMGKKIALEENVVECTVLEVKQVEGLGCTIDVILIGGVLKEGDKIVVCGMQGPIVTTIRALLTPQPMKELRVKGEYVHHKEIYAAMGVKIAANGLENAVAGTSLLICRNDDDEEELKSRVQEDMSTILTSIDKTQEGIYVVASTLGSLEALLDFLREGNIPVSGVSLGTIHKIDVMKASTMRERGHEEYSVILAFDVKIDPDAEKEAKELGVKIFSAEIIYHLFDSFTKHIEEFRETQREQKSREAVFPCELKIVPNCVFNKRDPILIGVKVIEGELRQGTPLLAMDKTTRCKIGYAESILLNNKPLTSVKKGQEVSIKITGEPTIQYGRHFDHNSKIISLISRDSINVMKEHFRDDLKEHSRLVVHLKKLLDIA